MAPSKKAVFITGCDSGFGYSLATHMIESRSPQKYQDFVVIAGCFYPQGNDSGAKKLSKLAQEMAESGVMKPSDFHILKIDVTDLDSVQKARLEIDQILVETKSDLWALINNAATLVFADAVFQTPAMVKQQFDVNVIGPWAVSKALIPNLIKGNGRIINMISFCTTCPLPTLSVYTATKGALLRLSEGMRAELAKMGVSVVLFNPGDHPSKTPLCANQSANFELMRPEVLEMFANRPDVVKYFDGIEQKFCSQFQTPEVTKLDDVNFYAEADKTILDPVPKHFYVNSPWTTRLFFWIIDKLPSSLGDKMRIAIMQLPTDSE